MQRYKNNPLTVGSPKRISAVSIEGQGVYVSAIEIPDIDIRGAFLSIYDYSHFRTIGGYLGLFISIGGAGISSIFP